eukprot:2112159-Heterocapsa_arctica.AAC.1
MHLLPQCPPRDLVEDTAGSGALDSGERADCDDDSRPGGAVRQPCPGRARSGNEPEGLQRLLSRPRCGGKEG